MDALSRHNTDQEICLREVQNRLDLKCHYDAVDEAKPKPRTSVEVCLFNMSSYPDPSTGVSVIRGGQPNLHIFQTQKNR